MNPSEVALVTGATEGIGRAIALALAAAGYRVGVCARTGRKVDALVSELRASGAEASGHATDVANPGEVHALVSQVERDLGPVDVLVNNAGIMRFHPIAELTLDDWDATMATNVRGLFIATQAVLPGMRKRRRGAIVNIASLAGRNGIVGGAAYTASKHAVLGFAKSLMLEVRKDDIRVITICPGSVDTRLLQKEPTMYGENRKIMAPEDVADVVLATLALPARALVSELDLRPTNP
jgi:3-oxoacyl-[acyl-carrier protein] reductase